IHSRRIREPPMVVSIGLFQRHPDRNIDHARRGSRVLEVGGFSVHCAISRSTLFSQTGSACQALAPRWPGGEFQPAEIRGLMAPPFMNDVVPGGFSRRCPRLAISPSL